MPTTQGVHRLDDIAIRWRDLADKRLEYFVELYRSGRWTKYYSQERFALRMLDVIRAAKLWSDLADSSLARSVLAEDRASRDDMRPAA